jgi:hypothetical protein
MLFQLYIEKWKINDKILVLSMKLLIIGFTNISLNTLNIFCYNYINQQ